MEKEKPSASNLWNRQPVVILQVVQTLLALFITFGLKLSADQIGLILASLSGLLAILTHTDVTVVPNGPTVPSHSHETTPTESPKE